jgi:chromosome segregation ATPase
VVNNLSNTLDREKAVFSQDIEKLTSERDSITKKYEVIEAQLREFTLNLQNKNDQYSVLKVEKENLLKELITLKTQCNSEMTKLNNVVLDNRSLKKHIIKLNTKIKENEDKIKEDTNAHENEIAKLKEAKQEIEDSYVMIQKRMIHINENTAVLSSDNGYTIVTIEQQKSFFGKIKQAAWHACFGPVHALKYLFGSDNTIHYTVKEHYTSGKDYSVIIGKDNSDADTNI